MKDLTAAGQTACIPSCVAFAPSTTSLGTCSGFRQTTRATCTGNGQREPQNDKSCFETITAGTPGYCDCELGKVYVDCGHLEGQCADACKKGYFGTFPTSGTGGAPNDAGQEPDATNAESGADAAPDGGDPCVAYYDPVGRGYACGTNLGADPARLYLCDMGATVGSVLCPSGCAAAPQGQPNYCFGTDPCVNSPVDGVFCASSLATPVADPLTLYTCATQATTGTTTCTNGCRASGSSAPDTCY